MEFTDARRAILDAIGRDWCVLRVKQRDDLGLVTDVTLFNTKTKTEVKVDLNDAAALLAYKDTSYYQLGKMNRDTERYPGGAKLGYVEFGCPEDGSEYYCLIQ